MGVHTTFWADYKSFHADLNTIAGEAEGVLKQLLDLKYEALLANLDPNSVGVDDGEKLQI